MKKIKQFGLFAVMLCMIVVLAAGCGFNGNWLGEDWDVSQRVVQSESCGFTERTYNGISAYVPTDWTPSPKQNAMAYVDIDMDDSSTGYIATGNSSITMVVQNEKSKLENMTAEQHEEIFKNMDGYKDVKLVTHGFVKFCGDTLLYAYATGVRTNTDAEFDFYQFAVSKNKKTYFVTLFINMNNYGLPICLCGEDVCPCGEDGPGLGCICEDCICGQDKSNMEIAGKKLAKDIFLSLKFD